jgi:hypothetical protein
MSKLGMFPPCLFQFLLRYFTTLDEKDQPVPSGQGGKARWWLSVHSSPHTYSPGPANPSMISICSLRLVIIGSHACRYRRRISCLARVWLSIGHIVVLGAGTAHPLAFYRLTGLSPCAGVGVPELSAQVKQCGERHYHFYIPILS